MVGAEIKLVAALLVGALSAGCASDQPQLREPGALIKQSYRVPIGEHVVFDMVTLVNDGPGDMELLAVSVPDGSGFELLDTRVLIAPLELLPGSGGRTPASIVDEAPLEGAVLGEGQGARPLLSLRVVDTGVGSSSFDHVIVTTAAGELRYDVGLEVCYGLAGSSSC